MKNHRERAGKGAHLENRRRAPLARTLNFQGAHQRNAPYFSQVRTLSPQEALQAAFWGWVARFGRPARRGRFWGFLWAIVQDVTI